MNKSITRNAIYNIGYRLLNVLFPLISVTYIARVLSPEGVGNVAYAQNIVSYFLMFAVLGIPEYGTREIARNRENPGERNRVFSELLVINFLSTGVCVGAYWLFVGQVYGNQLPLFLICGLELVFNFINVDWLYQGQEEYAYITLRSAAVKVLSILAMFLFVKEPEDDIIYGLILCMGVGGNYLFNICYARRSVKLTLRGLKPGRHIRPVLAIMISTAAASLYSKVDITMLGWLCGETAVGYYTSAHKVVSILLTLVTALSAVFLPRLSYLYENDKHKFDEYINLGLKVVLFLALPCCVGLTLVADQLTLVLFGAEFLPAASVIRILSVFIIVKGAGDLLCYQAVISSGKEKKLIGSRIAAGVTNILLNALLIPRYSYNGAAIASVVSELVVNGVLLPTALTITTPKPGWRFLGSLGGGTLCMGAAVTLVRGRMEPGLLALAACVAVGVLVFGLVMWITGNDVLSEFERLIGNKRGNKGKS